MFFGENVLDCIYRLWAYHALRRDLASTATALQIGNPLTSVFAPSGSCTDTSYPGIRESNASQVAYLPRSKISVGVNVGVFFRHEKTQPFQIGLSH